MSSFITTLNDIDQNFVKCVGSLYTTDCLTKNDALHLQMYLEEAIKSKTGISKDLTALVLPSIKPRAEEFKPIVTFEESKGSNSDNELELDLLKDDLMCIVCHEMDVGARNRLLECSDCHALYHQECHRPVVTNQDSFDVWVCQNCKDSKKMKMTNSCIITSCTSTQCVGSGNCLRCAPKSVPSSPRHSSSSSSASSSSYKMSSSGSKNSDKYGKLNSSNNGIVKSNSGGSSSSSSSGGKSQSSSSSSKISRTNLQSNMNILNVDKRLQIMKKNAAKRKLPR